MLHLYLVFFSINADVVYRVLASNPEKLRFMYPSRQDILELKLVN
jgi:hypothetical protein